MPALLSRLRKSTKVAAKPASTPVNENREAWSLAVESFDLVWTVSDVSELSACENTSPIYARLNTDEGLQTYQTLLLKYDLERDTITLDNFYPQVSMATLYKCGEIELQFPGTFTPMYLRCIAISTLGDYSRDGIVLKVLAKHCSSSMNPPEPVSFTADTAPNASLLIPLNGQFFGTLTQFSPHKFELTCLQPGVILNNTSALRGLQGDCNIEFSEEFTYQGRVTVKAAKAQRKPYNCLRLYCAFTHFSIDQRERLLAFFNLLSG